MMSRFYNFHRLFGALLSLFAIGGSAIAQPCTSGFQETPLWIQGQWDLPEGATTRVVLGFAEDVQMLAVQFGLSIDTTAVSFDGVVQSDLPGDLSSALLVQPHRINMAYVDINPVAIGPGDVLLSFDVVARRTVDLRDAVVLDAMAVSPEWINTDFEEFCLTPVYINTSGTSSSRAAPRLQVHPNPFEGSLLLQASEEGNLRIWRIDGRLVWSGPLSGALVLPTAAWASGTYVWMFNGATGCQTGRLTRR
jgi:hypothetical protein